VRFALSTADVKKLKKSKISKLVNYQIKLYYYLHENSCLLECYTVLVVRYLT